MKYFWLIIMFCLSFPAFADNAKFERRGTVLIYNSNISDDEYVNQITIEDVEIFRSFIEDKRPWKKIWTIRLTSQGGSEQAAHLISELILKHKLDTQASGMCASACTNIFIAGKKRRLMQGAQLLFHPHALSDNDSEENKKMFKKHFPDLNFSQAIAHNERLGAIDMIERHTERSIDIEFTLRVLSIHPDEEWIPSQYELERYGVIN